MKSISRTLHASASRRAGKQRESRNLQPEFRGRSTHRRDDMPQNSERVATYSQNFKDAPHASITTRRKQREGRHLQPEFRGRSTRQHHDTPQNSERVATYNQNFKDAPRASITTRRKQRKGRHLRPEFWGCSTLQRHDAPQTMRWSPLTRRISRTLHAPA